MNHNGFVLENDENIAYDKTSTHQQEDSKLEKREEKKEEQNKLTSVTYDSIDTPGAPEAAIVVQK